MENKKYLLCPIGPVTWFVEAFFEEDENTVTIDNTYTAYILSYDDICALMQVFDMGESEYYECPPNFSKPDPYGEYNFEYKDIKKLDKSYFDFKNTNSYFPSGICLVVPQNIEDYRELSYRYGRGERPFSGFINNHLAFILRADSGLDEIIERSKVYSTPANANIKLGEWQFETSNLKRIPFGQPGRKIGESKDFINYLQTFEQIYNESHKNPL